MCFKMVISKVKGSLTAAEVAVLRGLERFLSIHLYLVITVTTVCVLITGTLIPRCLPRDAWDRDELAITTVSELRQGEITRPVH